MKGSRKRIGATAASSLLMLGIAGSASAQVGDWQVIGAQSAAVPMPPLQATGFRTFSDVAVANGGQGRVGFYTGQAPDGGLWLYPPSGVRQRYMALEQGGAAGPGRSGAEQNHTFYQRYEGTIDAGIDGRRVFAARAGNPATQTDYTDGVWTWDGTRNIEIARSTSAAAGALGPGLPAGWRYASTNPFSLLRAGSNGDVLIDARVSNNGSSSDLVAKHVPGSGNRPCAMARSSDPALGPGLTPGDTFSYWNGAGSRSVDASGRMYGSFVTEGFRDGIWELCSGAPRPLAVDNETGARGPGIAAYPLAEFRTFNTGAVIGSSGVVNFIATVALTPQSGAPTNGVYRSDAAGNRPLALAGVAGDLSPHWGSATFQSFFWDSLDAAGRYVTFSAIAEVAPGQTRAGVWRAGTLAGPQPVAIIGDTGAYSPGAGQTWTDFYERSILPGGDILLVARTSNAGTGLWRLSPGLPPVRLIGEGQTIVVPTTTGNVTATITSYGSNGGVYGARPASGRDTWIAIDGSALVAVETTPSFGTVWLSAYVNDRIFADGFND